MAAATSAYQDAANSIYDPQAASEQTQAKSALDTSLATIANNKAQVDPYYQKAFSSLNQGEQQAQGQQTQTDNLAGLLDSGLHANQANKITSDYAGQRSSLSDEEAAKLSGYDTEASNAQNSYQSALSAIIDKYNGQKAAYINDAQQKDQDRAFQQRLADESAALQRELASESNSSAYKIAAMQSAAYNQPSQSQVVQQNLNGDIQQLLAPFGSKNSEPAQGYTEKTVIPQLVAKYSAQGMSPTDITNAVYSLRKSLYGQ